MRGKNEGLLAGGDGGGGRGCGENSVTVICGGPGLLGENAGY